jgi:hypothetical protein
MKDGRIKREIVKALLWWRDLCEVWERILFSVGMWFEKNIRCNVGDG